MNSCSGTCSGWVSYRGGESACEARRLGRSDPHLEPGMMRVYVTNGMRNCLNIGRRVGPCPRTHRRWVLGGVHAVSRAVNYINTHRPRFQVRARPSYSLLRSSMARRRTPG